MTNLIDHYPFPTFRPGMKEAIQIIEETPEAQYVLVAGRTGTGKSGLAVALARHLSAHIVTATKLLQHQYANTAEFDKEFVLKGKANYLCAHTQDVMNMAPCSSMQRVSIARRKLPILLSDVDGNTIKAPIDLKKACVKKSLCYYYEKKWALEGSSGGILNYDLVLSTDFKADAIVFDEAHNFIDKIIDHYSFSMSPRHLEKLVRTAITLPTQHTYMDWLNTLLAQVVAQIAMVKESGRAQQLQSLRDKIMAITKVGGSPEDYYVETDNGDIEIKTLKPKKLMQKLMSRFKKIFFMSATIDDKFAEILGLPAESTIKIVVPSTFKIEARPIIWPNDLPNINYKTVLSKDHPAIKMLDEIIHHHKDHKGIVHTANYRIMDELRTIYAKNTRFIWVDRGMEKDKCLMIHAQEKASILVSPSMMEGVDLHDDLARFQVIMKIPFPARTPYMEALEQAMTGWYGLCTRNTLVQAYGRPVRSNEDWATTYVLDSSIKMLINDGIDTFFTQAIKKGPSDRLIKMLQAPAVNLLEVTNEGKKLVR